MKFLPLIWAGLWRKPARTLLTLFSIVIAFILFGLLQGVDSAFTRIIGQQKLDRMFVDSRYFQAVPLSYKSRIENVKGVTKITEVAFMGGFQRDPKDGMNAIFTLPAVWLAIRPEFAVPNEQIEAVKRTRTGVIVSSWLAKHNNWKVGDQFTMKGMSKKDGTQDWTFDIVGIMHNPEAQGEVRFFLANYTYLDESRAGGNGTVNRFLLRIDDAARSARLAREIDALFANSPVATRTQSEQDQAQARVAQIGDFKFFTRAIMSAVFFALLFLTLNTTMESIRERTSELATLKTIGFTDTGTLALVLAESVALFVVAAAIGLAIAAALFPMAKQFVGGIGLPSTVIVIGALLAVAAAIASGIVPALRAKRLNIVQALAVR
jgi:putative ABC transport system permease protein